MSVPLRKKRVANLQGNELPTGSPSFHNVMSELAASLNEHCDVTTEQDSPTNCRKKQVRVSDRVEILQPSPLSKRKFDRQRAMSWRMAVEKQNEIEGRNRQKMKYSNSAQSSPSILRCLSLIDIFVSK